MSGDHNQHQKPTSKDSLQVEAEQGVDWEAVAADQAMTIAMMKSEQAEFQELVAKVQELEKQACEIIRREWVGLTEMDMLELNRKYYPRAFELMIAVEEKLKEKNNG